MKMKVLMLVPVCIAFLSGCATTKQLTATGGSKGDGTVKMAYEHGLFEAPVVDLKQGLSAAKKRCTAWGYSGAEAFGGTTKDCISGGSSCNRWRVTAEYQCTGKKQ